VTDIVTTAVDISMGGGFPLPPKPVHDLLRAVRKRDIFPAVSSLLRRLEKLRRQIGAMNAAQVVYAERLTLWTIVGQPAQQRRDSEPDTVARDDRVQIVPPYPGQKALPRENAR
jgi:hypothetical protein